MRNRVRALFPIVGVLVALCGGLAGSGSAITSGRTVSGSSSHHDRLEVLAGAPQYLVYLKYPGATPFPRLVKITRPIYVLGRSGPPHRLAAIAPDSLVSIAGSMVIAVTHGDDADLLRWWNLQSRAHGSMTYSTRGDVLVEPVAATPTGWLVTKYPVLSKPPKPHNTTELERVVANGPTTALGVPFPDGSTFDLSSGTAGALASAGCRADNTTCDPVFDGSVKWLTDAGTMHVRTLLGVADDRRIACGAPLNGFAACATRMLHDARSSRMRLMPLDGSTPTITSGRCPFAQPAVLGHSAGWIVLSNQGCPAGHLEVLSRSGRITISTRTFSREPVIAALGRLIVRSPSGRMLESVTSANAIPNVLVATP